jgi:hypothetical protein
LGPKLRPLSLKLKGNRTLNPAQRGGPAASPGNDSPGVVPVDLCGNNLNLSLASAGSCSAAIRTLSEHLKQVSNFRVPGPSAYLRASVCHSREHSRFRVGAGPCPLTVGPRALRHTGMRRSVGPHRVQVLQEPRATQRALEKAAPSRGMRCPRQSAESLRRASELSQSIVWSFCPDHEGGGGGLAGDDAADTFGAMLVSLRGSSASGSNPRASYSLRLSLHRRKVGSFHLVPRHRTHSYAHRSVR